jgi:hypothetical protein
MTLQVISMIFEIWRSIKKSMEKCTFATLFTTSFISLDLLGFKDFKTLERHLPDEPLWFRDPSAMLKGEALCKGRTRLSLVAIYLFPRRGFEAWSLLLIVLIRRFWLHS